MLNNNVLLNTLYEGVVIEVNFRETDTHGYTFKCGFPCVKVGDTVVVPPKVTEESFQKHSLKPRIATVTRVLDENALDDKMEMEIQHVIGIVDFSYYEFRKAEDAKVISMAMANRRKATRAAVLAEFQMLELESPDGSAV
jgi:hypothetical protein